MDVAPEWEGFMQKVVGCAHCAGVNEDRLWEGDLFRIVLVHNSGFEGWCRVVLHEHVAELTDLDVDQRQAVLAAVIALEEALRAELQPTKMNIAALATGMPHLHFHLIPRFSDDPTFPRTGAGCRRCAPRRALFRKALPAACPSVWLLPCADGSFSGVLPGLGTSLSCHRLGAKMVVHGAAAQQRRSSPDLLQYPGVGRSRAAGAV